MGKKIFMFLLTVALIFGQNVTAYAANMTTSGEEVSVPVKFSVNNTSFIITVPTVIMASDSGSEFTITASDINLRPEEYLEIFITKGCNENGSIILERQNVPEGKEIATLKTDVSINGKSIKDNNFRVGYFKDGSNSNENLDGKVTLSGIEINEDTESGDYATTVCFKVELKVGE